MNLLEIATAMKIEGFLHCSELETLNQLAKGREVLEIGAFKGLSAWGMGLSAKRVISVDTFCANSAGQFQLPQMQTFKDYTRATSMLPNVSAIPASSKDAATMLTATFDMIFLDAMHTYEDVRDDIERWLPRIRPGGVFAFHDYGHDHFPGVKQAVDEKFGELKDRVVTLGWIDIP